MTLEAVTGYTLLQEVARGGSSVVYRAYQEALEREVAIKILTADLSDPEVRERFRRECSVLGRISTHPHVVDVHDAGVTPSGHGYLVMPLYRAGSLADRIAGVGPVPLADVVRFGDDLAAALQHTHDLGIAHRDVKPENVLIDDAGEVLLSDVGAAVAAVADPTAPTPERAYTPWHAAPEVLEFGTFSPASDLYSLASTLYTALTGFPAYQEESATKQLVAVLRGPWPEPAGLGLPDHVVFALRTAMDVRPAARHESAAAFAQALRGTPARVTSSSALTLSLPVIAEVPETGAPVRAATATARTEIVSPAAPPAGPPGGGERRWRRVRAEPARAPLAPTLIAPASPASNQAFNFAAEPSSRVEAHSTAQPPAGAPQPSRRPTAPAPPTTPPGTQAAPARPNPVSRLWLGAPATALLICFVAVATVAPWAASVAMVAGTVAVSATDRITSAHQSRVNRLGRHWGNWPVAIGSAPFRLITALLAQTIAMSLGLLVGGSAAVTLFWLWTSQLAGHQPFGHDVWMPAVLAVSATAAGMTTWFGLGGTRVRRAFRALSVRIVRAPSGRWLTLIVPLILALATWAALRSGASPEWGPLPSPERILQILRHGRN